MYMLSRTVGTAPTPRKSSSAKLSKAKGGGGYHLKDHVGKTGPRKSLDKKPAKTPILIIGKAHILITRRVFFFFDHLAPKRCNFAGMGIGTQLELGLVKTWVILPISKRGRGRQVKFFLCHCPEEKCFMQSAQEG